MRSSERSVSIWEGDRPQLMLQPLREDLEADVCVVGAGIAGMSVAYLLARAGKRVIVLDDNAIGGGETGQTTAHLSSALDDRYVNIERLHGREGSRRAYESHQAAIERIGQIAQQEGIDCDYVRLDGYLFLVEGDTRRTLEEELQAAHRAGFTDVELLERAPDAPFDTGPVLRFPRQARFHPLSFLEGLTKAIHQNDGRIFTGSRVEEFSGGSPTEVRTADGFSVRAESLVVATNSPASNRFTIHTKQEPYRTFVIGASVPPDSVADRLYWDTGDPYHYVRLQRIAGGDGPEREILIVGGADERTGAADDADQRYEQLEAWTRERFPIEVVEFRWSGQVMEPIDAMAYIGRNPADGENVYVATGDSGHGMTHGMIAGMLISDLILGLENPWADLYDPGRVTLRSAKEFARFNLEVASHYSEWARGTEDDVASEGDIPRGEGAIVWRGMNPVATFRDEQGALHERSAVCTHLGCVVHWNGGEKSWDCPCHGSRFSPSGEVLNGPARTPLRAMGEDA